MFIDGDREDEGEEIVWESDSAESPEEEEWEFLEEETDIREREFFEQEEEKGEGGEPEEEEEGSPLDPSEVWQDPDTGLIWEVYPGYINLEGWLLHIEALRYCERLDLAGLSDWRIPTSNELKSLLRGCPPSQAPDGLCGIHDECSDWDACWDRAKCTSCDDDYGPDFGCYWVEPLEGPCVSYFTSTVYYDTSPYPHNYFINFSVALLSNANVEFAYVRCVHDPASEERK